MRCAFEYPGREQICVSKTARLAGPEAADPQTLGPSQPLILCLVTVSTGNLDVRLAALGEDAAIRGMSSLLVNEVFSPAAVNARLA